MNSLPDEIVTNILDYLPPDDIISSQRISSRILKLARDSTLWRYKCFEKAPSAAQSLASRSNALSALTGALGGLSLGDPVVQQQTQASSQHASTAIRASPRARAVMEWDLTHDSERIDWYSEYVARYGPLSTEWADSDGSTSPEIRGMALYGNAEKIISPLEDGSLGVYSLDLQVNGRRKITKLGASRPGLLFQHLSYADDSRWDKPSTLTTAIENISIDSVQNRAYIAAENVLNEIDLERMEVVAHNTYAWPITALSPETPGAQYDLTVGTSWSLHIHDPRMPSPTTIEQSASGTSERIDHIDGDMEDGKIAFLPNYRKPHALRNDPGMSEQLSDYSDVENHQPRSFTSNLSAYARVEPGPQSILHRDANEITIAGRMPSILFYDRRNFPKLQTVIHSGARLSAMTVLPVPPAGAAAGASSAGNATLIAGGEYKGCGSLEIYELPHGRAASSSSAPDPTTLQPYSYKNRQEASSAKILSVCTQGSRILFSDAEGTLKWVERNGRGLARRWNINAYQITSQGAGLVGEQVVRKMIALPQSDSSRGARGDGDVLVWTGERIGTVGTKPLPKPSTVLGHDDLVKEFEEKMTLDENHQREAEYAKLMRQAFERQADERRWMARFNTRR